MPEEKKRTAVLVKTMHQNDLHLELDLPPSWPQFLQPRALL